MLTDHLKKVVDGKNLTRDEAIAAMNDVMSGDATDAQIAAFITALRMKEETVDEITGFASVMREKAVHIDPDIKDLVDTCGTGGDLAHTFNISTTTAFVVAGCGVHVAKHGNRSVSSKSGSADVLEALGVDLDMPTDMISKCIDTVGIGFMFAPLLHTSMKHAITARREIGIRTVFNILGPLTNPAGARRQLVGVYDELLTTTLAYVLRNLGSRRALVVHGADGLDEISITGESTISELNDESVDTYTITPEQFGLKRARIQDIRGGDAKVNADILQRILDGEKGPKRDIVLLNASAAMVAAGRAENIAHGLELANESIDLGFARSKLDELVAFTNTSSQA